MARHGHVRLLLLTLVATTGVAAAFAPAYRAPALDVFDREDASPQELLLAFSELRGIGVQRLPVPGRDVPASTEWSTAMRGLYAAAGLVAIPDEIAALEAQDTVLDPRLQRALVPLVDAMAEATALSVSALAYEGAEARALRTSAALVLLDTMDWLRPTLAGTGVAAFDPECYDWATMTPRTGLSFLDTCDLPRLPAPPLEEDAWPTAPTSDPLGLVEIGTRANDHYVTDRWLLVEPAGDDVWNNNAGGAEVSSGVFLTPPRVDPTVRPVAVAWDLAGADTFEKNGFGIGAADRSVGILEDVRGSDTYRPSSVGQGLAYAVVNAVAIVRDFEGSEIYARGAGGFANANSVALMIDEAGSDVYGVTGGFDFGWASGDSDAYFRDSVGVESYLGRNPAFGVAGGGGGRAFFRDFGGGLDSYNIIGSNNARWTRGTSTDRSIGEGWDK